MNDHKDQKMKCCRCGKAVSQKEAVVIDRKVYCEKCARAKKDWDFLDFMNIMEGK